MQIVGGSNLSTMKGGLRNWLALFTRLSVEHQRAARSCVPTPKPSEPALQQQCQLDSRGFMVRAGSPRWTPGRSAVGMSVGSRLIATRLPKAHAPSDMPQRPWEDAHRKHRDHDHDRQDHPPNHGAQRPPPFMVPKRPHTSTIPRRPRARPSQVSARATRVAAGVDYLVSAAHSAACLYWIATVGRSESTTRGPSTVLSTVEIHACRCLSRRLRTRKVKL